MLISNYEFLELAFDFDVSIIKNYAELELNEIVNMLLLAPWLILNIFFSFLSQKDRKRHQLGQKTSPFTLEVLTAIRGLYHGLDLDHISCEYFGLICSFTSSWLFFGLLSPMKKLGQWALFFRIVHHRFGSLGPLGSSMFPTYDVKCFPYYICIKIFLFSTIL